MRYRIVVRGRLSPTFVARVGTASVEQHGGETVMLTDVDTPAELGSVLDRLGDLRVQLVSLCQTRIDAIQDRPPR